MGYMARLLKIIPGYHGYKNKEERRETDILIRNKAIRELEQAEKKFVDSLEPAVDAGNSKLMSILEKIRGEVRIFVTKIKNAEAGYKPGWNLIEIREKQLEQAISVDAEIVLESIEIKDIAEDVADKALMGEDVTDSVREALKKMNGIKKLFEERKDILSGTDKVMDIK